MNADWLLAVGCSLTWGTEITKPGVSLPKDKDHAWPAKLGELLEAPNVINRGWPGRSNGSIFRVAMEEIVSCYANFGSNGVVAIQWSGCNRLEFINPCYYDIKKFYKDEGGIDNHPGQDGPYLCVTPNELSVTSFQKSFTGVPQFFTNYWAHDFYQLELLISYSISLTSLANRLGVKILQFNGIDEIMKDILPIHAQHMTPMLGKEFYFPYDRSKAFWPAVKHFPRYPKTGNNDPEYVEVPSHPNKEDHEYWAIALYEYLKEIY